MNWFRRKQHNRRFHRRHVLDVKLSTAQRRQSRFRRLALLLAVASSVFSGLFAVWRGGEWLLQRFLYENPAFAIHRLNIETDGVLSIEQLRHWAGVRPNDNLWALDLARVKRDLELMPIIQSVAIERVMPHTLRILVNEREPLAQFVFPQFRPSNPEDKGVYYLDPEGFVMFPLEPHQRSIPANTNEHLTTLVGIPITELTPGRRVELPQVRVALNLIQAFSRSPMAGLVDIKQIDVGQPGVLALTTGQGSEITFGLNDLEAQLRRWHAIVSHGHKISKHLAVADLSVSNNIPTRWVEASLVSPVTPKPAPTLRSNRRKNV